MKILYYMQKLVYRLRTVILRSQSGLLNKTTVDSDNRGIVHIAADRAFKEYGETLRKLGAE